MSYPIHLHLHTSYSLWDGAGDEVDYEPVKDQVFGLTEHHNLYSHYPFKLAGYKTLPGVELAVKKNHITIYPKNLDGYMHMNRLVRGDTEELWSNDLIYLSGCINTMFMDNFDMLMDLRRDGISIYPEIATYPNCDDYILYMLNKSVENNLTPVITNDVHFRTKDDWLLNDVVSCINTKHRYEDQRWQMDSGAIFTTCDEQIVRAKQFGIPEIITKASFALAEKIASDIWTDLPMKFDLPTSINGVPVCNDIFDEYIEMNILRKYKHKPEYVKRLTDEINIIKQKDFQKFFIIVNELLKGIRKDLGVVFNYGRGSASGSLLCYLLGITNVDPIKYKLHFWRFIDVTRPDFPDIDVDAPKCKHAEIDKYIAERLGNNQTKLITINRYTEKSAVIDLARIFDIQYDSVRDNLQDTIEKLPYPELVAKLLDKPKFSGVHPAGFVFGQNIRDIIPSADMAIASRLNLVKLDMLVIEALDAVQHVYEETGENLVETTNMDDFAFDIDIDGVAGVFQLDAPSCHEVANLIKPKTIEDVVKVISLARAPALIARAHIAYSKNSQPAIMKEIFNTTRGVIIYQEQVLEFLQDYCNFDIVELMKARKIISKSKVEEFDYVKSRVMERCDLPEKETIWEYIANSALYLFNKSHATSYGLLACLDIIYKRKTPLEFYSRFANGLGTNYKVGELIIEARTKNIRFRLPTLRDKYSTTLFNIHGANIDISPKAYVFRRSKNAVEIAQEWTTKWSNRRKTFDYFPFHIYDEISAYKKKGYSYLPLQEFNQYNYIFTLGYVMGFSEQLKYKYAKVWITDGDAVVYCTVYDNKTMNIIKDAYKTKNTMIFQLKKVNPTRASILKAKVFEP